jgi:sugar lactone lactonase YvrE
LQVSFTPAYPGMRLGAVVLLDSGNTVIGTTFLNGTGMGGLGLLTPSAAQSAVLSYTTPQSQVPADGTAQTLAGDGRWQDSVIGDGGPGIFAELFLPSAMAVDGYGNIYIADSNHQRIRMLCAGTNVVVAGTNCSGEGIINTVAGGSGTALNIPSGVAVDGAGNLYIADTGNHVIREVSAATGAMSTIAGNGTSGYSGDNGPATAAELRAPFAIALDAAGNLFIADNQANVIRAVCAAPGTLLGVSCSAAGNIVTVAGNGTAGAAGDNGAATAAELNGPYSVAVDPYDNLVIADTENNKVRAVCSSAGSTVFGTSCTSAGMIFTVTGDGSGRFTGDGGPATQAEVSSPSGLALDPAGDLYIADTQNNRIRKVNASTGIIVTIAGQGAPSFGDGSALTASIHGPYGLTFYNSSPGGSTPLAHLGDLVVADYFNQRVRLIESGLANVKIPGQVRQGFTSPVPTTAIDPTLVTVENDGNAALDLTTLISSGSSEIGTQAISGLTLCADGESLAVGTQCSVEPIFAPAGSPPLAGPIEPESGNISVNNDVVSSVVAANSPLLITVNGVATLVNPTQVVLTSAPNPSNFGQAVNLTATVSITSGSGIPTGTVGFFDGAKKLDTTPLSLNSLGVANFSISTLAVGTHNITAAYNGDTNDGASNSNAVQQVVNEQTATVLKSSANPSALGSSVTFTATVTASSGGSVPPDGTVTFLDGATALGPAVALSAGGTATLTTSTLAEGAHSITAVYGGDATKFIIGSTSGILTQDVVAYSTVVLSPPVPNPSTYGSTVTLTVTVTSGATTAPTGSVTFFDGTNNIGAATLTGNTGVGTFTISTLAVGTHPIKATYAGDAKVSAGTSNTQSLIVNLAQTSTTVSASPTPGIAGLPVTLSAKVAETQGSATVTGTVLFTSGTNTLCQGTINGGTVSCTANLAAGSYSIVASYSGDQNDNASTSTALSYTVALASTQVVLTPSANPTQVLSTIVFKAVVSGNGSTPTGQVNFSVDGSSVNSATLDKTGTVTFNDSALSVGSHQVVATYVGDANDLGSSSTALSEQITAIPTITDLSATSTGGATPQAVLLATTFATTGPTPTGTITFNSGNTTIGSATLDSSGVATLTPNLPPGSYNIVAAYGGDSLHSPSASGPLSINGSGQGFTISVAPPSLSLVSGQNATIKVTITANAGFSDTIGMGCLTLPAAVNCHFSSKSVQITAGKSQTVQLTIDTNAPLSGGGTASVDRRAPGGLRLAAVFLPTSLFFGFAFWRFRRRHFGFLLCALILFLASAFAIPGCGSTFNQVTAAPGNYTIQVGGVGTNSNLQHYQNVKLTVTK